MRDFGATTQTSLATLTWTADKYGLAVAYSIRVSPDTGGISLSADHQGGNIQGLTPGMRYTLTITSTVAADAVYSPKIQSVEEIIWMSMFILCLFESVILFSACGVNIKICRNSLGSQITESSEKTTPRRKCFGP